MSKLPDHGSKEPASGGFQTTHWSMVLRAGLRQDPDAEAALASLCRRYWYPLYLYVRRRVTDVHQAQDLIQEFFARLLEKNILACAAPARGRFRSFLITALKNFLANEWDRGRAQKRGGNVSQFSLDFTEGESRLQFEPAHTLTPERLFERQWALTLLDHVMVTLRTEYQEGVKGEHFEKLQGTLTADQDRLPYAVLAGELGITEEAARQAARRLRKRYRELLYEEVAQTVADPAGVEDEVRSLFEILGSP